MTAIEWTDATWNPTTGCTRVSAGCDHCYIERTPPFRMAHRRFDGTGPGSTTGVQIHPDRLDQPLRWRKPRRVFVNSLSDLFHADIPDEFIAEVWEVMALASQHTFQILTKRPARMRALLNSDDFWKQVGLAARSVDYRWPKGIAAGLDAHALPNVHLGVSVEDQATADLRIPKLLDTPAAVRFLSCEPLLGPVDLDSWLACPHISKTGDEGPAILLDGPVRRWRCDNCAAVTHDTAGLVRHGIGWVIVGGESGPGARPMHPQWARDIRDQCVAAGVPFHFKQWGEYLPVAIEDDAAFAGGRAYKDPRGGRTSATLTLRSPGPFQPGGYRPLKAGDRTTGGLVMLDDDTAAIRVGKKKAGRMLDGRTWDQYPAVPPAPGLYPVAVTGAAR